VSGEPSLKDKAASDDRHAALAKDEIDSKYLLQGRQAITIMHNKERYQLRQTRQGKLILTK